MPCPLHIVGGHDDPLAPPDALAAWSCYSEQPRPVRLFAGEDFLLRQPDQELVTAVAHIVEDVAPERALIR